MPTLPKGIRFTVPTTGYKKYTAILSSGKKVSFGDRRYQQYQDSVPVKLGGGKWKRLDHGDLTRRDSYRARHGGMLCKDGQACIKKLYSPAWFSYYYLW